MLKPKIIIKALLNPSEEQRKTSSMLFNKKFITYFISLSLTIKPIQTITTS